MKGSSEELRRKGFNLVHVENAYYDGPSAGIVDVDDVPHYFRRDDSHAGDDDVHFVWPVDGPTFALEREQWLIFVTWNARYEAREATPAAHPAVGGVDARYDELEALLEPLRAVPDGAQRWKAEWGYPTDLQGRYHADGAGYFVRWSEGGSELAGSPDNGRQPPV